VLVARPRYLLGVTVEPSPVAQLLLNTCTVLCGCLSNTLISLI